MRHSDKTLGFLSAKHFAVAFLAALAVPFTPVQIQAATRTWDGGGVGGTNMDTPANWSQDTLPTTDADVAQWAGVVPGDLSLTYTLGTFGGAGGLSIDVTAAQTGALTINEASGTSGLRVRDITIANGAGAFTFGNSTASFITLGSGTVLTHTFTNNSVNAAAFGNNANFGFGGSGAHLVTLTGSGNWNFGAKLGTAGGSLSTLTKAGPGTLTFTGTTGGTGQTNIGTFTAQNGRTFVGNSIAVTAGVITIGSLNGSAASLYQSGSSGVTNTSSAGGAFQIGSTAGALGYYNLSGGTVNVAGEIDPGGSAGGAGTFGQLDMSGGTINLPNSGSSFFLPNRGGTGEASVVNFTGGIVQITGSGTPADSGINGLSINWAGGNQNNTTTISGSAQFLTPSLRVKLNQGTAFNGLGVGGATNTTALNLNNGGLLQTLGFLNGTVAVNPNISINFNGGTLKAGNAGNATFLDGLGSVNIYTPTSGTNTIDNNGQAITINQALLGASGTGVSSVTVSAPGSGYVVPPQVIFSGGIVTGGSGSAAKGYATIDPTTGAVTGIVITNPGTYTSTSGLTVTLTGTTAGTAASVGTLGLNSGNTSGGMTFQGAGTTTLSGASTYTGATTVNAGGLALTGSLASNITVAGGVTISGTGATSGSLTMNAGSAFGAGTTGPLVAGGGVNFAGSTNLIFLTTPTNGVYDLINYGAGGVANLGNFISTYRGGITNDIGNTKLTASVTTGTRTWNTTNGTWDIGVSTPWAEGDQKFFNADTVIFNEPTAPSLVTLSGTLLPASVTVTNNSNTYTFGGSGSISGLTSLTKSGSGTLVITTTNSYTGVTTINAGTLQIGNGVTDGSISNSSNVVNNSTLVYNRVGSGTYNGIISGSGIVIKTGSGTQTLGGANTFTGNVSINAGTLAIAADNNLGASGTSTVMLNGGTLSTTAGITNTHAITVGAAGGTINVLTTGQYFFSATNTLLGSGTLTLTGPGTLIANTGNLRVGAPNTYSGSVIVQGGGIFEYGVAGAVGAGATFTLNNQSELAVQGSPAVALPNNITVNGGTNSVLSFENGTLGNFSGNITLNGTATVGLRDWYNNATVRSGTISGVISGNGGLLVNSGLGTGGVLTLTNSNSFNGGTTISGAIVVAGTNGALGSGPVSLSATTGSVLQLGSGVNVSNLLTINGGGATGVGALSIASTTGTATYSGAINITGPTQSGGHFTSNNANGGTGGTLILAGPVTSATTTVVVRAGTVIFSNTNNNFSSLSVSAGTVKIGANNALPVGATVDMGAVSPGGTLDLSGFNQTLAGITKNAVSAATVTNSVASTTSTLTTTGTSIFGGTIQSGSGTTALTVSGGSLTLTGSNGYTGATNVTAGTLIVSGSLSATSSVSVGAGGTLEADGRINPAVTTTVNGSLQGTGGTLGAISVTGAGSKINPGLTGTSTVNFSSGGANPVTANLTASSLSLTSNATYVLNIGTIVTGTDSGGHSIGQSSLLALTSATANSLSFGGSTLQVNDLGVTITPGEVFKFINYASGAYTDNSTFGTITSLAGNQYTVNYAAGDPFVELQAVPEPQTYAMLLGGTGMLLMLRRRRKR